MIVKALSANRLRDGVCVWYGCDGVWHETMCNPFLARERADEECLQAIGQKAEADNLVIDVNLIEIDERGDGLFPVRLRERIRIGGPTAGHEISSLKAGI